MADYVLGQANFRTRTSNDTQSGLDSPMGIIFDAENNRLFVAEELGNRIKVFDVASITNGENAIAILGQLTFTSSSFDTTQSKMNGSQGMAYDAENDRLFVADRYNNRVMIFDVTTIDNGEDAVSVLGQANFDDSNSDLTNSTLYEPKDVAYDPSTGMLFVADMYNSRVMVFDVASVTNGEPAVNVLGQADFESISYDGGQSLLIDPVGLTIDSDSSRLFVSEGSENRVLVFDVAADAIADGMPASNVIGQANFDSTGFGSTITALSGPRDIDFDHSNGRLYVSEYYGSRVKVFDVATTTPVVEEAPAVVVEAPRAKGTSSSRKASNIASMGGSASVWSANVSGGGDAVISTVDLATFIERLKAILAGTPVVAVPQPSNGDLDLGSRGDQVISLQKFLMDKAIGASAQALVGVGATGYFGQITQKALAEYQASVGISPATGYFGPKTRAHLKSLGY
jgi:DNA-binding beta-propeller fold protein YncE